MNEIEEHILGYQPTAERLYRELEEYYLGLTLREAVFQAGSGFDPNFTTGFAEHQRRVGKDNCRRGAEELVERLDRIDHADSFEEIMVITDEVCRLQTTFRLGPLWSYDTAQRIGFRKGHYPQEVYLYAGAEKGAVQLCNRGMIERAAIRRQRSVSPNVFPDYLSIYEPYIIENLLCVGHGSGWFV